VKKKKLKKQIKKGGSTMKALRLFVLAIIIMSTFSISALSAAEAEIAGYASVDVMSNYVWRGQKLSDSLVIQPSVGITYGGFDANLWSNFDSDWKGEDTDDGQGKVTETDLTLSYSFSKDKFNFSAGYIYYGLEGASDTQELFFSAAYDVLLNPTLILYYDYDEGQGAFIVASIDHSFDLGKNIPLDVGASASYNINNKVMGVDEEGDDFSNFYNGELYAAVTFPITEAFSISPKIAYSFPLSNDAKEAISSISYDGDKDIFYGGINLTLSF
jgi:hypothetical protein